MSDDQIECMGMIMFSLTRFRSEMNFIGIRISRVINVDNEIISDKKVMWHSRCRR